MMALKGPFYNPHALRGVMILHTRDQRFPKASGLSFMISGSYSLGSERLDGHDVDKTGALWGKTLIGIGTQG